MKKRSNEDIVDVSGVRKSDVILQVGRNLPFMNKFVNHSTYIEDANDVPYVNVYDKIFVNGAEISDEFLGKLACISVGTIIFLDIGDDNMNAVAHTFETKWYPANVWSLDSNIGKCIITDAKGPSLKVAANG